MALHVTGVRKLKSWEDHTYSEVDGGPKAVRSTIEYEYTGDIQGTAKLEYVMVLHSDDAATFTGYEQIVGRIGDREGSVILEHRGVLDEKAATVTLSVVPGSGTGQLAGAQGTGGFTAVHEDRGDATYTLDLDLA